MLPEIRKYANEYRLSIDSSLANKVEKCDKGVCEKCDFTRERYYLPFANNGNGIKTCLACTMSLLTYDDYAEENDGGEEN